LAYVTADQVHLFPSSCPRERAIENSNSLPIKVILCCFQVPRVEGNNERGPKGEADVDAGGKAKKIG
jgi:hypothetical protein